MTARIEVVILPVSDPDRSLQFYRDQVGFELDVDYAPAPDFWVVQLTPDGSAASIQFGVGLTDAAPGSLRGTFRPGIDSSRADYASFADFRDPDGNAWVIQERGHH
jgi:catechol 2,3-dioxygenase-like lactoylglutathione lyase family enzyme